MSAGVIRSVRFRGNWTKADKFDMEMRSDSHGLEARRGAHYSVVKVGSYLL